MTRRLSAALLVLAIPSLAAADGDYRHGRVRHVEGGVSIQRAEEPGAEEAIANVPFLPGDRVWTDEGGRAEFQFASGAFLRVDSATKLDYVDHSGDGVVLRLWSGSLHAHDGGRGFDLEIETPAGVIATRGGVHRVDARDGDVRLSVYEGEATLRGEPVREGEQLEARSTGIVRGPHAFDRNYDDDFASWIHERDQDTRYARQRPEYLPEDVAPYYDELYENGTWYMEPAVGYVWRPYVVAGWQPYTHGRWIWTAFGWTWVPRERWGWATCHYGRWGYSPAGWYWIPQRGWGPAWVSWAVGGPYVGWVPLGRHNRPVTIYGRGPHLGNAVRRNAAWVYARQGDLTAWDVSRKVVTVDGAALQQVRTIASPRARLTKDLQLLEGPAAPPASAPRTVRTKPTIGDTVPELATDNKTTIRGPVPRRRGDPDGRYDRGASFGEAAGRPAKAPAAEAAPPATPATAPADREPATYSARPRSRARAPESSGAVPRARERGEAGERQEYAAPPKRPQPVRERSVEPRTEAAPRAREAAPRTRDGGHGERAGGSERATPREAPAHKEPAEGGARAVKRKD